MAGIGCVVATLTSGVAVLAGCAADDDYLARAEALDALASDGAQVYYVRDDELVREDGTALGAGASSARSMVVDATHAYLVQAGGLYRYPIGGGAKQALFAPDADFSGEPVLVQDAHHVYVLTTKTEADWFGKTVTITLGVVTKDGGLPVIRDNRDELVVDLAGDGERVFGVRKRVVDSDFVYDIVELGDTAPSRLIWTWPTANVTGIFAGLGAIYVRAHDGLWRLDPTGASTPEWLSPEPPRTIELDDRALYIQPSHAREASCGLIRQTADGSSRCLLAPGFAIPEMALVGDYLYYTKLVDDQYELHRIATTEP